MCAWPDCPAHDGIVENETPRHSLAGNHKGDAIMAWEKEIVSRRRRKYVRSEYNGSWWIVFATDKPNRFVGAERYLPKEIVRKLKSQGSSR